MAEKEYIEREAVLDIVTHYNCDKGGTLGRHSGIADIIEGEINRIPAADVELVKHGHIVWKQYRKGGIRRKKCLQEEANPLCVGQQRMPCKHIAIVDERYLSKDPYCSECGKLLGEFLSYCGNCGAKMDGGGEE